MIDTLKSLCLEKKKKLYIHICMCEKYIYHSFSLFCESLKNMNVTV